MTMYMRDSLLSGLKLNPDNFETIGTPLEFTAFKSIYAKTHPLVFRYEDLIPIVAIDIQEEIERCAANGERFRMMIFSHTKDMNKALALRVLQGFKTSPIKFDHFIVDADGDLDTSVEALCHPSKDNLIVFCTSCFSTGVNAIGITHCYVIGGTYSVIELSQMFFRSGRGPGASPGKCYLYFAEKFWRGTIQDEKSFIDKLKSMNIDYNKLDRVLGIRSMTNIFQEPRSPCVARYLSLFPVCSSINP
jgi:hypothetical protein